jgi:hypothetical protein
MIISDDLAHLVEESRGFRTGKRAANDRSEPPPKEFIGAIGNLYARKQLSPPFDINDYAKRWLAAGIPPEHCLDTIRKHLEICAHQYRCGSGDKGIDWVDALIHSTWYNRNAGPPIVDMWDHSETWVAEPW